MHVIFDDGCDDAVSYKDSTGDDDYDGSYALWFCTHAMYRNTTPSPPREKNGAGRRLRVRVCVSFLLTFVDRWL